VCGKRFPGRCASSSRGRRRPPWGEAVLWLLSEGGD
jgi:hypothetical protein